ncbi:MAG: MATE family efflux transporter [Xanthomonadales bacterium]|nr:MATE family efflux transporter [Xanthomonadales bacterium]
MKSVIQATPAARRFTRGTRWWVLWRRALSGETRDYTRGPIRRSVFLLAVPMVLEMTMEAIFAITDIFWVARLGADAVTAVGLTEAFITLLYAVAIGLSMGTTAMIARRVGEQDYAAASVVAAQTLWMGALVALVVGALGIFLAPDILALMGASPSVIETGSGYTSWLLGGGGTIGFIFLINAIFRGAGDASIAMRALLLANSINIVLDPLLIYGVGPFPEMGVAGAAVATTIGRGVGVAYQLYALFGHGGKLHLHWSGLGLDPGVLKRLLKVSLGGMSQFLIGTSSWIFIVRIVASYGSDAVAGYTIAIRIFSVTFLPAWGLSNAAATLVGQNLGANRPQRAERSVWRCTWYNTVFLTAVAILCVTLAEPMLRLFTDEPEVIRYGAQSLFWISLGYPMYAVGMVLVQAFNGAGDTRTPTWVNLICFWMLQIPLAWTLANQFGLGPRGVFMAIAISETMMALMVLWLFRRGRWKMTVV